MHSSETARQTRISVSSVELEATSAELCENAIALTDPVWPLRVCIHLPGLICQIFMVLSFEAEARTTEL